MLPRTILAHCLQAVAQPEEVGLYSPMSTDNRDPQITLCFENLHDLNRYPLVMTNIAMEHGPFIDGLSIKNGDFPWLC